jgi:hypothetical protein
VPENRSLQRDFCRKPTDRFENDPKERLWHRDCSILSASIKEILRRKKSWL